MIIDYLHYIYIFSIFEVNLNNEKVIIMMVITITVIMRTNEIKLNY